MSRAKAVYRALLHCYPAAFRNEYGGQMLLAFAEQMGEAHRNGSRLEPAALWAHAAMDIVTIAPKEHCHVILQDLRYALRTMAAQPGFTAVAILSLALGIGANTAIFSLWNGVLHAPLPAISKPEQLVMLTNPDDAGSWIGTWNGRTDGPRSWLSYQEFEDLRDHAGAFSGLMASQSSLNHWDVRIQGGAPERVGGRFVSGGFFELLGVHPFLGQLFTAADDRTLQPTVVISYNYWQHRFGGRPDVLGKTVAVGPAETTIIGVTPPSFIGETSGQQPDVWLPLRLQPVVSPHDDRLHDRPPSRSMWLHVFGRLKPGVTPAQAESQANALFLAGLESFYGSAAQGERRSEFLDQRLKITPAARGASSTRYDFSNSLTALLAAVGVLLLIACANLANLLLARGAARRREIALRLSLGAGRGRIVRQLLTESLALAAMGGVASVAVAYFLHGALVRMMAEADRAFHMDFTIDPLLLGFLLAATLGSALLFGALPAWQATNASPAPSLKEQGRGSTGSRSQIRSGRLLVSLQLALSLPLLVGAGLLARTAYNLQRADLGFPTQHLLLARVNLWERAPQVERRTSLYRELLAEFRRIPGVRAVTFSQLGIFSGGESSDGIAVEGHPAQNDHERNAATDVAGPGYFSSLGIPLLLGRDILESDSMGAPAVCVINEAFARRFFSGRNPLGMRITLTDADHKAEYHVVGVAKDARTEDLRGPVKPRFFTAAGQDPPRTSPTFLIRTATETAPIAIAVRKAIQRVDAALPVPTVDSLEEQMAPLTAQDRTIAQLAIVFGLVALALAAIGLYGVLSYGVARRAGEIAIRIALGSQPSNVVAIILRETLGLLATGLAIGAALAWAAVGLIHSRLYGVAPQDPLTLAAAAALLMSVALFAAYLPARRASRLDPITALRQE